VRHAERTVAAFGVVCLISGLAGLTAGKSAEWVRLAFIAGAAVIVFSV
jgi:hypothetical protein